ncbi:YceI family protein [Tamlana haliotis]|uniref:YceI family protein n=1 Tax=Pseudotamlana haliotis TaxID=2614804 RepID=A0A6N6MFV9_9FLAO|nr:YceI family protein [Tamlana haliotis]KAB1068689.1 YceI family protein [Tamlana haliotis]
MKNSIKNLVLFVLIVGLGSAFSPYAGEKKEVNVEASKVTWKAYKVLGSHEGTIAIQSGMLEFDNDQLTGGKFVMDMPTLVSTDMKGDSKVKLENHLKSEDFFEVEKHPTSTLVFTDVKPLEDHNYQVTGDLTIKNKTNSVSFNMIVKDNKASATLNLDRTHYGVEYKASGFFNSIKESAIRDEFEIVASIVF